MIGIMMRLNVRLLPLTRTRVAPEPPYLDVRANSLVFCVMALQIASKTALALLMLTPTPSAMRIGIYARHFHPACLPNSSRCPNAKNVLAEHVARTNRLKLKMYWVQVCALNGL